MTPPCPPIRSSVHPHPAMATSIVILLSFALFLSLSSQGSLAQLAFGQQGTGQPWASQRRLGYRSHCQMERLFALEPTRRVPSEAGFTEYFDQHHEQFQCAGVAALRRTIQPRGLLLPSFSNAPSLIYIAQGRGITGMVMPGCPETYQSFSQTEQQFSEEIGQSQRFRDEHQRIRYFREGDVIAVPAGVAHWCYNNGEVPVVMITVSDTSNSANQLDRQHREFLLAGRERQSQQEGVEREERSEGQRKGNNLLSGFELELLANALGVDKEVARKIQNLDDRRGEIVHVEKGLAMIQPIPRSEEQIQEQEREERQTQAKERRECESNGLEEAFCAMKHIENIRDLTRADYYNPRAGRITSLNSQKLPILRFIQMSAQRGVLHRNAIHAPLWNINAHSLVYVLRGRCRMQIVGHKGQAVFDGELRQGQMMVVPQNFAVIKQAQSEQFEWISIKTNDNAMVSHMVGKASTIHGMPLEVLMNSFRISRDEAKQLKFNRANEMAIFNPRYEREQIAAERE